ncbi:perforin-1-like [Sphaeramia orbicularis]|nr:perforin-1-like [Sphaeramia orbicularis]
MVKLKDMYDWKVGADLKVAKLNVGGGHSDSFEFAQSRNDDDHYTFSSHWQRFSLYRHAVTNKRRLNDGFKNDVKKLPRSYNSATKDEYREFIRKYGTHYIHRVTLGGQIRRLAATRTCLSRLNDISTSDSQTCISLDLEVGLGLARLKSSCSDFLKNRHMKGSYSAGLYVEETMVRGGDPWSGLVSSEHPDSKGYHQWKESLKRIPMIVDFVKKPLYDLVNEKAKHGLEDAINAYIRDPDIKFSATNFVTERSCSHHGDCCPERLGQGWLTVTILRGFRLYGDVLSATEGYVEISYGGKFDSTRMIQSNDPQWDETFYLGLVDTTLTLTLELRDKDPFREERLFYCEWDVRKGSHPLSCKHKYGVITAEYSLECVSHLTGDKCDIYEKMSV